MSWDQYTTDKKLLQARILAYTCIQKIKKSSKKWECHKNAKTTAIAITTTLIIPDDKK